MSNRKTRTLVTGGAGFIGSHVVDTLLEIGHQVVVMDNLTTGTIDNVSPEAELCEMSVTSQEATTVVVAGKFDLVVHLAAQVDIRRSVSEPLFDLDVNLCGTINLLEAVRLSRRNTRIVFASTGGALYGDHAQLPTPESAPKSPESPYGLSKLCAEQYLAYYERRHGMESITLRFGNVYGPRQDPNGEAGVVAIYCGRLLAGNPLVVFGDGLQTRDYVFAPDVADAIVRAGSAPHSSSENLDTHAFNIATGEGTSVLDLARMLQRAAGTSIPLEFVSARHGEVRASRLDVRKAQSTIGWQPRTPLKDGLKITFEWFSKRATVTATSHGSSTIR